MRIKLLAEPYNVSVIDANSASFSEFSLFYYDWKSLENSLLKNHKLQ